MFGGDPALMEKLNRCLTSFKAEKISDLSDVYTYHPDIMGSKLGSGSYGETFRVRSVKREKEPLRVAKVIPKSRVSKTLLQVQHLCAELAVTNLVRHPRLNKCVGLYHNDTYLYIILELIEGPVPDIATRLYAIFAKHHPARIAHVEGIVAEWEAELSDGVTEEERSSFFNKKVNDLLRTMMVRKEPPVGSDLFNLIVYHQRIEERLAAIITRQSLEGIAHLHSNTIVHRDIKTENVVLGITRKATPIKDESGAVTGVRFDEKIEANLIDFGLVKYMAINQFPTSPSPGTFLRNNPDPYADDGEEDLFDSVNQQQQKAGAVSVGVTPCGTELYCALEVVSGILNCQGQPKWQSQLSALPKIDVYGVGTMLFCMTNGFPPFRMPRQPYRQVDRREKLRQIRQMIEAGPKFSAKCPEGVKDITLLLMHNEPAKRPSADEALRHPYFRDLSNVFSYEVDLSGTLKVVDAPKPTPLQVVEGKIEKPAPEEETTPQAAVEEEEEGNDDDDIDVIDELMAVVRGKEDNGDSEGKGRREGGEQQGASKDKK